MAPPKMKYLSKFAPALLDPEAKNSSKLGKELENEMDGDFDEEMVCLFMYYLI